MVPQLAVPVIAASGIAAVVAAMSTHRHDEAIAFPAAVVLGRVARQADHCAGIAAAGGIPALVSALMAHKTSKEVPVMVCTALESLVAGSPDRQAALVAAGGIPAVVATLHARGLYNPALRAPILSHLAAASADYRRAIAAAGGIRELLAGMPVVINLPSDKAAEYIGPLIEALMHMAADAEHAATMAAAGAAPSVVGFLMASNDGPVITHCKSARDACLLLARLAGFGFSSAVDKAGGIPVLVSALTVHADAAEVVAAACQALSSMAAESGKRAVAIATAGGVPAVVGRCASMLAAKLQH